MPITEPSKAGFSYAMSYLEGTPYSRASEHPPRTRMISSLLSAHQAGEGDLE